MYSMYVYGTIVNNAKYHGGCVHVTFENVLQGKLGGLGV